MSMADLSWHYHGFLEIQSVATLTWCHEQTDLQLVFDWRSLLLTILHRLTSHVDASVDGSYATSVAQFRNWSPLAWYWHIASFDLKMEIPVSSTIAFLEIARIDAREDLEYYCYWEFDWDHIFLECFNAKNEVDLLCFYLFLAEKVDCQSETTLSACLVKNQASIQLSDSPALTGMTSFQLDQQNLMHTALSHPMCLSISFYL